ncbi:MAG: ABC transporter ATP-binding protein [Ruminococcus sp.]|nr:ABC transporter ATP-binding protein [Ruminococcus sp.]
MKNTILSAKDLCKSFAHNGGQLHILQHIDLDLYEGDFTVIMGASGSGKSTLLYSLSGMDRATSGQVIYNGTDLVTAKENTLAALRHTDFGFIFQQMHLVSNLTLFENVAVSGYLNKKVSASEVKNHAFELLKKMNIAHIKTHLPSQVSGGEQQRCAIARAVVNKPRLLFADEPTGALNRRNTTEVLNLLTELNNSGQSILMVTHDLRASLRANRIVYLEDGKIIGELSLPPYHSDEEQSREVQVNAWLSSMEW